MSTALGLLVQVNTFIGHLKKFGQVLCLLGKVDQPHVDLHPYQPGTGAVIGIEQAVQASLDAAARAFGPDSGTRHRNDPRMPRFFRPGRKGVAHGLLWALVRRKRNYSVHVLAVDHVAASELKPSAQVGIFLLRVVERRQVNERGQRAHQQTVELP